MQAVIRAPKRIMLGQDKRCDPEDHVGAHRIELHTSELCIAPGVLERYMHPICPAPKIRTGYESASFAGITCLRLAKARVIFCQSASKRRYSSGEASTWLTRRSRVTMPGMETPSEFCWGWH